MRADPITPKPRTWSRTLWNLGGALFLSLGLVGIPLPILPTTPFLLLAAACFLRGSPRMHRWMLSNRWFGQYLSDYRAGRGIPRKTKAFALTLLWLTIGGAIFFWTQGIAIRILLAAIGLGVTVHLLRIKTNAVERPGTPADRKHPPPKNP